MTVIPVIYACISQSSICENLRPGLGLGLGYGEHSWHEVGVITARS